MFTKAMTLVAVVLGSSGTALAQNLAAPGASWSSGWGFQSMSQRSLLIQQAQAIRSATTTPGPSTIVYNTTTNDNRSNYQDINTGATSTLEAISFQIADVIGQNTNAVGAMNTGTTNIEIAGSNNSVTATNGADSNGCIDGSVHSLSSTLTDLNSPAGSIAPIVTFSGLSTPCLR